MCLVPLFIWARGIVSSAIFGHLEAFWNKNYLTKCVQNLILYKIKVLKSSQNASKWPKMAELTIPAAQIKSGTKHIVGYLVDSNMTIFFNIEAWFLGNFFPYQTLRVLTYERGTATSDKCVFFHPWGHYNFQHFKEEKITIVFIQFDENWSIKLSWVISD